MICGDQAFTEFIPIVAGLDPEELSSSLRYEDHDLLIRGGYQYTV
jgi:hypothetical protein